MFAYLLDELILSFCYRDLTLETGGFELASTMTFVLQANGLTKCASHLRNSVVMFTFFNIDHKHPFWAYLVHKIKPVNLS